MNHTKFKLLTYFLGISAAALFSTTLTVSTNSSEILPNPVSEKPLVEFSNASAPPAPEVISPASIPVASAAVLPAGFDTPTRIEIPAISVDAKVFPVGLTPKGDMDMVKNSVDIAWYMKSAIPGNAGAAVVGGHERTSYDPEGVFFGLKKLKIGDVIEVTGANGRKAKFVVRKIKMYNYNDPTAEVFTSKEGSHLHLITCDGEWMPKVGLYSKRLVIFADFVTVE